MADEEILALLKQGSAVWNSWNQEHRPLTTGKGINLEEAQLAKAQLDGVVLYGAKLSLADLSGANLSKANLSTADVMWARLFGANLRKAEISRANLHGVNLREADLREADLVETILSRADLSFADLRRADLRKADLKGARFEGANLEGAQLTMTDLSDANLEGANLKGAYLSYGANLSGANLRKADLREADLKKADLSDAILDEANLVGADLQHTRLVNVSLKMAKLDNCRIYGISAWDLDLDGAEQTNLIISPDDQPIITVDNLKVAQFIYLLLNNQEIREVIDSITSKAVLILGRFTPERKGILNAIRTELRNHHYLPILFDFEKPSSKSFVETVSTLAHMARFVIADVTDAKVVLQELQRIVPDLPSVPIQPLLLKDSNATVVLTDFMLYPWFLEMYQYENLQSLLTSLADKVIAPAEAKAQEIASRRKQMEETVKALSGG